MLAVKTAVFEGPLDLLLHLIERDDLDITTVSLVQVTDQYIAALRSTDTIDLRALAEFVAVGARLMLLKSRALLPRNPEPTEEDLEIDEMAADLTAQLEEYRVYKNAASYLKQLDDAGHRSFVRVAAAPDFQATGLERVTMKRLLKALSRAMERIPPAPPAERRMKQVINIHERRRHIMGIVRSRGRVSFARLISECRTRLEAIVTFIALLDLLKTEDLVAEQDDAFGEITLSPQTRIESIPDHLRATDNIPDHLRQGNAITA
jgi:segregation and condensation protein A